jgi:peptidoglycan/xylan/chitin deacetylase (PgdA/CDA1 family)
MLTHESERTSGTLVLCYHAISDTWPAELSITQEQLRRQLEWLLARGYRAMTFHDAVASTPTPRTFVVTFDDAYRSVLDIAYPILESLGIVGTVFAVTDFAASGRPLEWPGIAHWKEGRYAAELSGLTWSDLGQLAGSGWEIGSHTCTHPRLTRLPDEELNRELHDSRVACEQALGRACTSLAYPYGDFDARVAEAAGRAGYSAAAIEDLGRPAPLTWPRVGVYRGNSMRRFKLKVSPTIRRLRTALVSEVARA